MRISYPSSSSARGGIRVRGMLSVEIPICVLPANERLFPPEKFENIYVQGPFAMSPGKHGRGDICTLATSLCVTSRSCTTSLGMDEGQMLGNQGELRSCQQRKKQIVDVGEANPQITPQIKKTTNKNCNSCLVIIKL